MQLSDHFSLNEFLQSATASARGITNMPTSPVIVQMSKLCNNILEPIRIKYLFPIKVTSGYRCEALNKAVGGAKNSQHLYGMAADIKATHTDNATLFRLIKNMIDNGEITVGQLIWEYGTKSEPKWIHVSLPREGKPVNQIIYLYSK